MVLHIVVADSHVVRLLRCELGAGDLEEVLTFYNSEARLAERELVSDRAGRVMNRPAGVHQAYTPRLTAAQRSLGRWLTHLMRRELRHVIDRYHSDGLVLVATARVLSRLRAGLVSKEYPPVVGHLTRNLVQCSVDDLKKRLQPRLAAALAVLRTRSIVRPKLRHAWSVRTTAHLP